MPDILSMLLSRGFMSSDAGDITNHNINIVDIKQTTVFIPIKEIQSGGYASGISPQDDYIVPLQRITIIFDFEGKRYTEYKYINNNIKISKSNLKIDVIDDLPKVSLVNILDLEKIEVRLKISEIYNG